MITTTKGIVHGFNGSRSRHLQPFRKIIRKERLVQLHYCVLHRGALSRPIWRCCKPQATIQAEWISLFIFVIYCVEKGIQYGTVYSVHVPFEICIWNTRQCYECIQCRGPGFSSEVIQNVLHPYLVMVPLSHTFHTIPSYPSSVKSWKFVTYFVKVM